MDSRRLQLYTFLARTSEIRIPWKGQMATLLANEPSIQMGHHGPELSAEDAVGAAHDCEGHRGFWPDGESERQRSVKNLVTAALTARWK